MKQNISFSIILLLSAIFSSCDLWTISQSQILELDLTGLGPNFKIENASSGKSILYNRATNTKTDSIIDIAAGNVIRLSSDIPNEIIEGYEYIIEFTFLDQEITLNTPPYEYSYTVTELDCGIYPAKCIYYKKCIDENTNYSGSYIETILLMNYIEN